MFTINCIYVYRFQKDCYDSHKPSYVSFDLTIHRENVHEMKITIC